MRDAPCPPSPAAGPGSWTGPLGQEIPLHLELADLLVQPGHQGVVVLGLLVLTVAEHTGGSLGQGLLPGLNLARVDFVPDGQLGHCLLPLHRIQGHPRLEGRAVLPSSLRHVLLLPDSNSCP